MKKSLFILTIASAGCTSNNDFKKGKITKIDDLGEKFHVNGINKGYQTTGYYEKIPTVGECFYIGALRTSIVQEIIDSNTFKTMNSVYKLEEL
jgi:hypothetical protein